MDGSGRHPGAVAKVPRMPGGLRCNWDRSRTLGVNCNVSADAACTLVRGVAVIPCSETSAPPNRIHVPNERLTWLRREDIREFHFSRWSQFSTTSSSFSFRWLLEGFGVVRNKQYCVECGTHLQAKMETDVRVLFAREVFTRVLADAKF